VATRHTPDDERQAPLRLGRLAAVKDTTGLSKSSIYARIEHDGFPKPIKVGPRASRWEMSRVEHWVREKARQSGGEL
jgi:prophage regulatory protein